MAETIWKTSGGFEATGKVRIFYDLATNEAGMQIKLTNKTGTTTVKGDVVESSSGTDRAFELIAVGSADPFGIVYESGIADGAECWVWLQGCVQVRYQASTIRGDFARVTVLGDDADEAGVAISEAFPTSPFSTDKHFQEVGHLVEAIEGAGLALTIINFN